MFIQGDIQVIFDALYAMGAINPALQTDWSVAEKTIKREPARLKSIIHAVNRSGNDMQAVIENLRQFDQETLLFLAMEVARELVEFEDRKVIH